MAIAGSRVSTMEKPRFWITTSPESATLLYARYTRKRQTENLAGLASHHSGLYGRRRHGQYHRSIKAD
jgi:hypothetical protein